MDQKASDKAIKGFIQDGNFAEALKICESLISTPSGGSFNNYFVAASCALELKLKDRAADYFEKSVEIAPIAQTQKIWKVFGLYMCFTAIVTPRLFI